MGPLRHLESRDSTQIAQALHSTPPIRRDPRLTPTLLHCAHALSIPVRLGIDFVAKPEHSSSHFNTLFVALNALSSFEMAVWPITYPPRLDASIV